MAKLIKKETPEATYTIELTERELNTVTALIGETGPEEDALIVEEHGDNVLPDSYELYKELSNILKGD